MLSHQSRPGLGLGAIIRENHLLAHLSRNVCRITAGDLIEARRAACGDGSAPGCLGHQEAKGDKMAAMKPRTGDGPLEVTKEGRGIVMRVPLEGGGRLVVEMTKDEANDLSEALKGATG
jgi:hypothetical protein